MHMDAAEEGAEGGESEGGNPQRHAEASGPEAQEELTQPPEGRTKAPGATVAGEERERYNAVVKYDELVDHALQDSPTWWSLTAGRATVATSNVRCFATYVIALMRRKKMGKWSALRWVSRVQVLPPPFYRKAA